MTQSEQLLQVLKEKQPRRIMVYMEVEHAGKWVWEQFPAGQGVTTPTPGGGPVSLSPPPPTRPTLPSSTRPAAPVQSRKVAPPMTNGRDPARHLITIGKFKGQTIDEAVQGSSMDEVASYALWAREEENPGVTLEVCAEMIEAYMIERQYVPTPKYKTPRRNNAS